MEKYRRFLWILVIALSSFLLFAEPLRCNAHDSYNIHASENVDYYEEYVSDIFVAVEESVYTEPKHLEGVFVSKDGSFLIVFSDGGIRHHIEVYNSELILEQRLVIDDAGSVLALFEESGRNIILYFIRRNIIVKVDSVGNYLSAALVTEVPEDISSFDATEGFSVSVDGKVYELFIGDRNKTFTVTSYEGAILYQCTVDYKGFFQNPISNAFLACGGCLLVVCVIILAVLVMRRWNKGR